MDVINLMRALDNTVEMDTSQNIYRWQLKLEGGPWGIRSLLEFVEEVEHLRQLTYISSTAEI